MPGRHELDGAPVERPAHEVPDEARVVVMQVGVEVLDAAGRAPRVDDRLFLFDRLGREQTRSLRKAPAEEPVNEAPAPPSDPRISAGTEVSHQPHSELSGAPAREVLPASFLTLPEEAVSSSSSIAISSRRSVPMPSGLKPETQSSKDVLAGRLLKRVDPSYPQEAMQQRIEGTVRLHVVIGDDGKVLTLEPVSGPPLLVDAAVVAIHQWRYGPTLFDGHRVQVQEDVRLVFRLPD